MPRSKLLDKGEEIAEVFPVVLVKDDRGQVSRRAGQVGHKVRVTVSNVRGKDEHTLRLVARSFPGDDFARVVLRGTEWDVVAPPSVSSGVSRASRHFELVVRARNGHGLPG